MRIRPAGLALSTLGLALSLLAVEASSIPMRNVRVTERGATAAARMDVFLPPSARYCHGFVRSYLLAAGPDRWYVIGRYGRFRVNFRPCIDGEYDQESVSVRFRDTGGGLRRICFEAWTPLASSRVSRHFACTADFRS